MSIENSIKKHARDHCANFTGANGCLLEPNGQSRCNFFREDEQARPFIESGTMGCPFFERSVLGLDPVLQLRYFNADKSKLDKCGRCKGLYVKKANASRYCDNCKESRSRQTNRDRQRRHYWQAKENLTEMD